MSKTLNLFYSYGFLLTTAILTVRTIKTRYNGFLCFLYGDAHLGGGFLGKATT